MGFVSLLPDARGFSGGQMTLDGRPIARWPRIKAGRDDDLGTSAGTATDGIGS